MITLQQIQEHIQLINDNPGDSGLVLYPVLSGNGQDDTIRLADLAPAAATELKIMILDYLSEKFLTNPDLYYSNITDADSRGNTAFYYDLTDRPAGLNVLNSVLQNDDKQQFSFTDDQISNIKGFVITIGNEENTIALYKRHHRLATLKADTTFGIRKSDHRFVKVEDDIIKLSKTIDFLQIGTNLIITNLKALEDGFGYEQAIRSQATANIQAIADLGLLEDVEPLTQMATDLKQAKNIMKIKRDSPVMQLPIEAVIQFVSTHRPIMRKFKLSPDGSRLKLDTVVSRKLFLALMNDDLLTSELTRLYYAGLAKDKMEVEEE